jgi:hypothetical protein
MVPLEVNGLTVGLNGFVQLALLVQRDPEVIVSGVEVLADADSLSVGVTDRRAKKVKFC